MTNGRVRHKTLFNFSASPVGGGLKRVSEYASWFDAHGGAWFMVHAGLAGLGEQFPRNQYVIVDQSRLARMVDDFASVRRALAAIGSSPDCYYAYGIPLYARVGRVNWFHLSNVLPLTWRTVPLRSGSKLRFRLLGRQILKGLPLADVISAESNASLSLFAAQYQKRLVQSVNGSDDEIAEAGTAVVDSRLETAVVVGTYPHKALEESCLVFEALRSKRLGLHLIVFGDERLIPSSVRSHAGVVLRGNCARSEVIAELRRARYYISTTLTENSYNAASEGAFLAEESFVSDIGPHRELLADLKYERVVLPGATRPILHVKRAELSTAHLKTWAQVIEDMTARIDAALAAADASGIHAAH